MPFAWIGAALVAVGLVSQPASDTLARSQQAPPPTDIDARVEFLRSARVIKAVPIGKGVTRPQRLTLSDGTFTHDAAFQAVDERASMGDLLEGRRRAGERDFVDYWGYNVAAFRIARLLGLADMMPVTVERSYKGNLGALSWWVDEVMFDEEERQDKGIRPPDQGEYERQVHRMSVFAALVADTDRNKGNVLYTRDWRLVMLDFTRAFRLSATLREPQRLQRISHDLYGRLQALTEDDLVAVTRNWISIFEIRAVLHRRDLILQRFDQLVAERGAENVYY
ncbi:MAG: hypothetical protein AB7O67_05000 [Vicinamibacterales bacterium]